MSWCRGTEVGPRLDLQDIDSKNGEHKRRELSEAFIYQQSSCRDLGQDNRLAAEVAQEPG